MHGLPRRQDKAEQDSRKRKRDRRASRRRRAHVRLVTAPGRGVAGAVRRGR